MQETLEQRAEKALRFFTLLHSSTDLSPEARLIYADAIRRLGMLADQHHLTVIELFKLIDQFNQELSGIPPFLNQEVESFRQVLLVLADLATLALDQKRFW